MMFLLKVGIMCRSYQTGVARHEQIVVSTRLRHQVMGLAHGSTMAGHMEVRQAEWSAWK